MNPDVNPEERISNTRDLRATKAAISSLHEQPVVAMGLEELKAKAWPFEIHDCLKGIFEIVADSVFVENDVLFLICSWTFMFVFIFLLTVLFLCFLQGFKHGFDTVCQSRCQHSHFFWQQKSCKWPLTSGFLEASASAGWSKGCRAASLECSKTRAPNPSHPVPAVCSSCHACFPHQPRQGFIQPKCAMDL